MRENSVISTIWKSFYSQSIYRDVKQNWSFAIIAYIFILVLIYTVVAARVEGKNLEHFIQSCAESTLQQLPTGSIVNGKMSIEQISPHTVYYQEKNKPKQVFAIFDMTNKTRPAQDAAFSVFHSNGYFYNSSMQSGSDMQNVQPASSDYTFHAYPSTGSFHFSAADALVILSKIQHIIIPTLFIGAGVLMLLFKFCQPIIYALVGLIFGGIFKLNLSYGAAYRLAVVSSTPAFLVITVGGFFVPFPHPWLTAFIIQMLYLYFAVYANRQGTSE